MTTAQLGYVISTLIIGCLGYAIGFTMGVVRANRRWEARLCELRGADVALRALTGGKGNRDHR